MVWDFFRTLCTQRIKGWGQGILEFLETEETWLNKRSVSRFCLGLSMQSSSLLNGCLYQSAFAAPHYSKAMTCFLSYPWLASCSPLELEIALFTGVWGWRREERQKWLLDLAWASVMAANCHRCAVWLTPISPDTLRFLLGLWCKSFAFKKLKAWSGQGLVSILPWV